MPRRIVIASQNPHKIQELSAMLSRARFPAVRQLELVSASALPEYGKPPEIDETAITFVGNAVLKATGIATWLRALGAPADELVLADDLSLAGREGAAKALDILRDEIDRVMVHIGAPDITTLGPHCIWKPHGINLAV